MITMASVLERGFTSWDQALLPSDEFEERVKDVQRAMRSSRLDGLAIWSPIFHSNGDLTYLAGWPMSGILVLTSKDAPAILGFHGEREQHFNKMQTWVGDLRPAQRDVGKIVAEMFSARGVTGGRLGVVGSDKMNARVYAAFAETLADFELLDFEDTYQILRMRKRPREVLAIRKSLAIAERAVAAGEAAFAAGATNTEALIESERVARIEGARDFRALANIEGPHLRPFERLGGGRQELLLLWVAVDHHGYWAAAANISSAESHAQMAVAAMVKAARAGADCATIARAGLARLPAEAHKSALAYGLGSGIGLGLNEAPSIKLDNHVSLVEGSILALQCYAASHTGPSLAVQMVRVGADEGEVVKPL